MIYACYIEIIATHVDYEPILEGKQSHSFAVEQTRRYAPGILAFLKNNNVHKDRPWYDADA
jgi:hypothetical protein